MENPKLTEQGRLLERAEAAERAFEAVRRPEQTEDPEHQVAPVSHLLAELRNIADADPSQWDENVRDQFQQWAQNRARTAIAKAEGNREQSPGSPASSIPAHQQK